MESIESEWKWWYGRRKKSMDWWWLGCFVHLRKGVCRYCNGFLFLLYLSIMFMCHLSFQVEGHVLRERVTIDEKVMLLCILGEDATHANYANYISIWWLTVEWFILNLQAVVFLSIGFIVNIGSFWWMHQKLRLRAGHIWSIASLLLPSGFSTVAYRIICAW